MITSTGYIDGSWELSVKVTDYLTDTVTLRVPGELHIGGLMLKLAEVLQVVRDWSDYALWWPEKCLWLRRTRSTLDQYGVNAGAVLEFTTMHKNLKVMTPDLQMIDFSINFSINVLRIVIKLCKDLSIRHPEEMSLSRRLDRSELTKNKGVSAVRRTRIQGMNPGRNNSLFPNSGSGSTTPESTLERGLFMTLGGGRSSNSLMVPSSNANGGGSMTSGSMYSLDFDSVASSDLSSSPELSAEIAFSRLYCPKSFAEKARINSGWLDSSRSLMEQDIHENDVILLRFKFFNFYDLSPKYDSTRINQIYEQSKWAIISEENYCSEDEMIMFAALQRQVELQKNKSQPPVGIDSSDDGNGIDAVDSALDFLQMSLEGASASTRRPSYITATPELNDYITFYRAKKFGLNSHKRAFFNLKDITLSIYRDADDKGQRSPKIEVNLKECEVSAKVNMTRQEFNIKLLSHESKSVGEFYLKLDSLEAYAKWLVAFQLATDGKTMADGCYDDAVESIRSILRLQQPTDTKDNKMNQSEESTEITNPELYVPQRFLRKINSKQVVRRIMEAHAKVSGMNLIEAKLQYVRAWQMLAEYGKTYFIVKVNGKRKEELLAISPDRLSLVDSQTGEPLKTWAYRSMKDWSVNWDSKQVLVTTEEQELAFQCLTADCKVLHEFIGGYVFLSTRSSEKSQTLDEETFQKLTGGWD